MLLSVTLSSVTLVHPTQYSTMDGRSRWMHLHQIHTNTCLVLHSDKLECQGQKSKVKVTRDKKRAAAGASMWSLARGVFAGLHNKCGVCWARRATSGLCHAFLLKCYNASTEIMVILSFMIQFTTNVSYTVLQTSDYATFWYTTCDGYRTNHYVSHAYNRTKYITSAAKLWEITFSVS